MPDHAREEKVLNRFLEYRRRFKPRIERTRFTGDQPGEPEAIGEMADGRKVYVEVTELYGTKNAQWVASYLDSLTKGLESRLQDEGITGTIDVRVKADDARELGKAEGVRETLFRKVLGLSFANRCMETVRINGIPVVIVVNRIAGETLSVHPVQIVEKLDMPEFLRERIMAKNRKIGGYQPDHTILVIDRRDPFSHSFFDVGEAFAKFVEPEDHRLLEEIWLVSPGGVKPLKFPGYLFDNLPGTLRVWEYPGNL